MTEDHAEYNVKPKKGIDSTPEITLKEPALMTDFTGVGNGIFKQKINNE